MAVGGISGGSSGTIESCYNSGSIYSTVMSNGGSSYNTEVGGISGRMVGGTISKCYNTGSISVNNTSYNRGWSIEVGGIVGVAGPFSNIIEECYNTGSVGGSSSYGNPCIVGGIIGLECSYTIIRNCFNTGTIASTTTYSGAWSHVGGIAGAVGETGPVAAATITNCYNIGAATATSNYSAYAGAIIGNRTTTYAHVISNCYFYRKTTTVPSVGVGSGTSAGTVLTQTQARTQSSYSGWDFTNTWQIDTNYAPHLRNLLKPASVSI